MNSKVKIDPMKKATMQKITGSLALILLIPALALTSSANAALPEFLPTTGSKFIVKSGKSELTPIKCNKDKGTGETTGSKTLVLNIDFEECTLFGVSTNSLGDSAKVILHAAFGELCYINQPAKEVGVILTLSTAHVEVPLTGELFLGVGKVIAKITPVNLSRTAFTLTFPKPAIKSCGGKEASLTSEKNESKSLEATEEVSTEEATFEKGVEIMA